MFVESDIGNGRTTSLSEHGRTLRKRSVHNAGTDENLSDTEKFQIDSPRCPSTLAVSGGLRSVSFDITLRDDDIRQLKSIGRYFVRNSPTVKFVIYSVVDFVEGAFVTIAINPFARKSQRAVHRGVYIIVVSCSCV